MSRPDLSFVPLAADLEPPDLRKPAPSSGKRERWTHKQERKREEVKLDKRAKLDKALYMRKLREAVYERDHGCCRAYGHSVRFEDANPNKVFQMHHVIPLSAGGGDVIENVCVLSMEAHDKRHGKGGILEITGDPMHTLTFVEKDLKGVTKRVWQSVNPSEAK